MAYLKTPWYKKDQLDELYAQLQPGCRLEFKRRGYFHWAIYVKMRKDYEDAEFEEEKVDGNTEKKKEGNGDETDKSEERELKHTIIHRCVPPNVQRNDLMSSLPVICYGKILLGQLILTSIENAVGDYEVRINNEMDKKHSPKDPAEIVAIAVKRWNLEKVEQKPYSLLIRNCEHFVNQCRYGIHKCDQLNRFASKAVMSTAIGGASVGARVGIEILAASALVPAVAAPAIVIGGSVLFSIPWIVLGIQHLLSTSNYKTRGKSPRLEKKD